MEKSIRRLLSVMLALVLTVGVFPGTALIHAAEISTNGIDAQQLDDPEEPGNTEGESNPEADAFWEAIGAFDAAVQAFWAVPDAFSEKYNSMLESETLTEAQYEELKTALASLTTSYSTLKQAVETAHGNLATAYNALSDEEKNEKDENDSESVSPKDAMEGSAVVEFPVSSAYEDVMSWELPTLPQSPYLTTYLERLDSDTGIYTQIGALGDALEAFSSANEAYQTELNSETPDSSTLESLYQTALDKYNELTTVNTAFEKEYAALTALYEKVPDNERALEYGDGNGVSIEWNTLKGQVTECRNNVKAIEKPAPLGKNVSEDIQPGTPSTKLVYTDKDAFLASVGLSDEEKSSTSIEVVFKAASKSMTQTESELTASKLPEGYETGCALDLSMYLNLNGEKKRDITQTAGPISISVTIPQNLINSDASVTRNYKIVRIHGGDAQVLDGTYNAQDHTFTFSTDRFSTYVIIYRDDTTAAPTPGTGDTGTTDSGTTNSGTGQNGASTQNPTGSTGTNGGASQTASAPSAGTVAEKAIKTGDDTPLAGLLAGMISSLVLGAGCIGYYVWRRKKNLAK